MTDTTDTPSYLPSFFTSTPLHSLDFRRYGQLPGGWTVVQDEDTDTDWSKYSKAWHRSYGPSVTVSNRRLVFRRKRGRGVQTITVNLDSWRGDYVARGLLESGLVQPQKGMMHVRLNPAYGVHEVRQMRGYRVFERTLAGQFVDVCLVSPLGMTFHAETLAEAFSGLRAKTRQIERQKNASISYKFLRGLGFCETGIKTAAEAFRLEIAGTYTPDEVAEAVRNRPSAAMPFLPELRQLAEAVGFQAPELTA